MKRKLLLLCSIVMCFMLAFAGCSKDPGESPTGSDSLSDTEPPVIIEPEVYENPLTGLPMETNIVEERNAVVVSIGNMSKARPQSGISKADILYEVLAEGGITRVIGVFLSEDVEKIGPVRSARPYIIDIAMEYKPVFCFVGGSPDVWSDLSKYDIPGLNGITDSKTYWRSKDRKAPDNCYTSTALALEQGAAHKFNTTYEGKRYSFQEEFTVPTEGEGAEDITIKYINGAKYTASYSYDSAKKLYFRKTSGEDFIDKENEEQISVTNIIIQYAKHKTLDSEGRQDVTLTGSGEGYYITGGKAVKLKWKKDGRFEETEYTLEDGTPLKLNQGKTFIHIVPTSGKVTMEGPEPMTETTGESETK